MSINSITSSRFHTLLNILGVVIIEFQPQTEFIKLLVKIRSQKLKHGSIFILQDPVKLMQFQNTLEINYTASLKNGQENAAKIIISEMNILNSVITSFSVLSGLSNSEWVDLALYIIQTNLRIAQPSINIEGDFTKEYKELLDTMLSKPWLIAIMLLEVSPDNYPLNVFEVYDDQTSS